VKNRKQAAMESFRQAVELYGPSDAADRSNEGAERQTAEAANLLLRR
jgi:hypothetical protein